MWAYLLAYDTAERDSEPIRALESHLTSLGGVEVLSRVWVIPIASASAMELVAIGAMVLPDGARIFVSQLGEDRAGRQLKVNAALFW